MNSLPENDLKEIGRVSSSNSLSSENGNGTFGSARTSISSSNGYYNDSSSSQRSSISFEEHNNNNNNDPNNNNNNNSPYFNVSNGNTSPLSGKLSKVKRALSGLVKRSNSPSPVTILPNGTTVTLEDRPSHLPPKSKAEQAKQRKQYEEILENIKKREAQELKKNEKKDKAITDLVTKWTQDILPNWKQLKTSKKVEELIWAGLPPSIRGKLWLLSTGNDLHITKDLFQIFLTHARNKLKTTNGEDEEGDWGSNPTATAEAAAATLDGSGSAILHNSLSREQSVHLISLDVSRTFPHLCIFQIGGPYYDSLRSILEAYVCYRPDVGYVQGMSFMASMLLLNMDVVDAFICLANLLNRPVHLAFYRMDTKLIHHYLTVYQVLLKEHLPLLFNHLQELGLNAEVYLIDWMLTVFSKALPLDLASRVWDAYLYFGDHFLYRCALGILKYYQEKLLSLQFGEAAELLTHIPRDLDDDDLFYMISTIPLNKTRFEELVQADNLDLFCAPALSAAANKSSSSLGV